MLSAIDIDELPILEMEPIKTRYVDFIGAVELLEPADTIRIRYMVLRTVEGRRYKVPVFDIIQPTWSCRPGSLQRLLARARHEVTGMSWLPTLHH